MEHRIYSLHRPTDRPRISHVRDDDLERLADRAGSNDLPVDLGAGPCCAIEHPDPVASSKAIEHKVGTDEAKPTRHKHCSHAAAPSTWS